MKTFITIMLILAGLLGGSQQQNKTVGYKSLAECNNDTLQYLLANFKDNKQQYIGKKMSVLLNDLEFAIEDFGPLTNSRTDTITGLAIWYLTPMEQQSKYMQGLPVYELIINFEKSQYRTGAWHNAQLEAGAYWRKPYIDLVKNQTIRSLVIAELTWDGKRNNVNILSK